MKKRIIFVENADYYQATQQLDNENIKWRSEERAFYFHMQTAIITAVATVLIVIGISML